MAIKIKDFIIQAKVKEGTTEKLGESGASVTGPNSSVSDSEKQEIIDECLERINELIEAKLKV
ncbi:MAG: hypothetical protein HN728_06310 [Flavobacteriales bacterium]|jgi:hypothetical protein|nr:hypothetical protein [Flavobacteriales bacterium]MBT6916012.1 hypothetical protein [Flavobacteriales bacterium]MBT7749435.1 hypothetical protein [Flavobacteriales bacterium]NCG29638.1 hypothetical protein [Bacteroidota bacterium]